MISVDGFGSGLAFFANVQVPVNVTSPLSTVFVLASHFSKVQVPSPTSSTFVVGSLAVTVALSSYSVASVGLNPSISAGRVLPSVPLLKT